VAHSTSPAGSYAPLEKLQSGGLTSRATENRADPSYSTTVTLTVISEVSESAVLRSTSFDWQDELQRSTAVGILRGPDPPTVVLDD